MASHDAQTVYDPEAHPWRRRFSIALPVATLGLIFLGGQVKSHEAGLAVPDWPTTFGYNMFLFPVSLMQGGIFHEHLHRLVASGVGLMTLIFAFWCWRAEPRRWVRNLAWLALAAVIVQGLLGGLTVVYLLPDAISIAHGVLAQTFLALTVLLAYAHSKRRAARLADPVQAGASPLMWPAIVLLVAVYGQLILGATMRHMEAGLAIYDFPSTAGSALPVVNQDTLERANAWRTDMNFESDRYYPEVTMAQVAIHMAHRYGALVVTLIAGWVTVLAIRHAETWPRLFRGALHLDAVIAVQASLGIATVISLRVPEVASLHVVGGAALLASAVVFALRAMPVSFQSSAAEQATAPKSNFNAPQVTS